MNEYFAASIFLLIFIACVSVTVFYLMPKFNSILKALFGSILIPYIWILIIFFAIFFNKIVLRFKFTHQTPLEIIFSFITETITFIYLRFGVWIISLIIFVIWYIRKRSANKRVKSNTSSTDTRLLP